MAKIKICGLCRREDIQMVNRQRPDYIGFVFASSRRQVSLEEAEVLSRELDPGICPVGVYVNADLLIIEEAVKKKIIRAVQLHGQESLKEVEHLRCCLDSSIPIIKALGVTAETIQELEVWQDSAADYLLLDAKSAGSGKAFDHSLIEKSNQFKKPWFLAGGIKRETAARLNHQFHPYGIDISSGAETNGCKDEEKIKRIVREIRR